MSNIGKECVLYTDKLCDNCGECERCDLDPSKLCDNCGKCIAGQGNAEFRSLSVKALADLDMCDTCSDENGMDLFLDEPVELGMPEALDIDPVLQAKWEKILADSLKRDSVSSDESETAPVLRAVRRRRPRVKSHSAHSK